MIILKYAEKLGLNAILLLEKLILLLCSFYQRIIEGRKKRKELGGKRREMLTKLREEGRVGKERSWKEDLEKRKEDGWRNQEKEEEYVRKEKTGIREEEIGKREDSEIKKLDLVLDLDETLIYCSSRVRKEVGNVIKLEGKEYQILVRPKCEEFLEKVFLN